MERAEALHLHTGLGGTLEEELTDASQVFLLSHDLVLQFLHCFDA